MTDQGRRRNPTEKKTKDSPELSPKLEQELLARATGGDTKAFGQLVKTYQDLIYGLVFRMVRDPSLAEELTQDAFIKAFRSLSLFRGESKFTTWLYRIAVNVCHDQRESLGARNRKKETSIGDAEFSTLDSPAGDRPDQVLETAEAIAKFQTGLDALEEKYREAFLLRHQEGLGYEEIAEILGISKSNAKVRVHRAREMILETLRSLGFDV